MDILDDFGLGAIGDRASGVIVCAIIVGLGTVCIVTGLGSESIILQVSRTATGVLMLGSGGLLAWLHRPGAEKASFLVLFLVVGGMFLLAAFAFVLFFAGEFVADIVRIASGG